MSATMNCAMKRRELRKITTGSWKLEYVFSRRNGHFDFKIGYSMQQNINTNLTPQPNECTSWLPRYHRKRNTSIREKSASVPAKK